MRINEAIMFLNSFKNEKANLFVQKMMKNNYAESIIEHYPGQAFIDNELIFQKCDHFVDMTFDQIKYIRDKPEELLPLFHKFSRKNPIQNAIWFNEFDEAYLNYKHNRKLSQRYDQLKPFLSGSSYCDIGCGGGDLIAYLKKNHHDFIELAGIDVLDWRTDSIKDEFSFQMLDFSQPDNPSFYRYDTLTCLAVLHHVGETAEEISVFLDNVRTALNEEGTLIVEEDVILPPDQLSSNNYYKTQTEGLAHQQPNFAEFLKFEAQCQKDVLILIDFLSNSLSGGVPDMAFPFGFQTINRWTELFSKSGFKVDDVRIQGFVEGRFNRSSHVFFILKVN